MKIGIIGAGAMGGLYGVRIALSGVQVSMVEKNTDAIASIQNQWYHLSGITGDHFMKLDAGSDPAR